VAPGFLPAYVHLALSYGGWRWWRRARGAFRFRARGALRG